MILSHYRYRDVFFELLTEMHLKTYDVILRYLLRYSLQNDLLERSYDIVKAFKNN